MAMQILLVTGCYATTIPRMLSLTCVTTVARSNLGSSGSGKPPAYMTPTRVGLGDQQQPPPYRTPGRDEKKQNAPVAGAKQEKALSGINMLLSKKSWRKSKLA
ncbi:unnamed protein product [Ectocarpus fasciculatus]